MGLPDRHSNLAKTMPDDVLKQAIDQCASEPIHISGAIQPHGYMIVLDRDLIIRKVSQNIDGLFSLAPDVMIGRNLSDFLSDETIKELQSLTSEGALNPIRSMQLSVPHLKKNKDESDVDTIIHKCGDNFIIEMELVQSSKGLLQVRDFYHELLAYLVNFQKIDHHQALYNYVTQEIKRLTGFGRVKLYRFDDNWNGEVVAESKDPHMASYLGLHFPHSDIPEQARKLYAKNYLRLIPDISYEPVPLFPDDSDAQGKPLDLTFSVLRSVSPVHLRYLDNMGVKASMSISIMQNDKLWGLIACHHNQPHHVPYAVRMGSELVGHGFSALLSNFMQNEETIAKAKRKSLLQELSTSVHPILNLKRFMDSKNTILMDVLNADGIILRNKNDIISYGDALEDRYIEAIDDYTDKHFAEPFFFYHPQQPSPFENPSFKGCESAFLVVPVPNHPGTYLIWFRHPRGKDVYWAGKPEKNITRIEGGFQLTPRASFERWHDVIKSQIQPWSEQDIETSAMIGRLITQKKIEDALRQKSKDLNSVLNNSNAIIFFISKEGHILNMNDSALEVFDLKKQNVIGAPFQKIFYGHFADLITTHEESVLKTKQSITMEKDFVFHGKEHHFIAVKFPLYDHLGEIYATCTIATDISKLRATEEKLIQSNKELEQMAFIASHDLQEPLRHITNFTDRLHKEYHGKLDQAADTYLEFMVSAAKRMQKLITDLLSYSRISHEKPKLEMLSTKSELATLIKEFKLVDENNKATINIHTDLPDIMMNSEHFACVMQNLIANGIKYRREGVDPVIDIYCVENDHRWVFSVKDNGIGIKKDYFDKIFQIFQRLHNNDEYPGTGIGLALCLRLIKSYGGEIWIESEFGKYSQFFFTIPKNQT